jgi:hypothetical protein
VAGVITASGIFFAAGLGSGLGSGLGAAVATGFAALPTAGTAISFG